MDMGFTYRATNVAVSRDFCIAFYGHDVLARR
jgi:hypothetical protein